MKKIIPAVVCVLFLSIYSFTQNTASAQSPTDGQFQVLVERPNEKTFKGIISPEVLHSDTSFKWYAENLKGYKPNAAALEGLKMNKDSIQLLTFMGTWCEDSHFIIPKLYSLADSAGFSQERMTLIGVDRNKTTLSHLSEALNVTKVPTIIVLKNGIEQGRVVEFGKYGLFDMELGEILKKLNPVLSPSNIR